MGFNRFKTFILLAALTAILLFIGQFFGTFGLGIAVTIVVLMNFVTYFWSDKIVLKMYRAKEVKPNEYPELYSAVKEISQYARIPMPKVYILPSEQANAFATGRNPQNSSVAFTHGIMNLLTKEELKGVIAHEISHIKNRDVLIQTIAATIAGIIGYLASIAQWTAIFGGFGNNDDSPGGNIAGLIVIAILAPLIATIVQLAISRAREYMADATGAKLVRNPHALASALEKISGSVKKHPMRFGHESTSSLFIYNPFKGSGLVKLFSTHPPIEDRIKKLKKIN